MYEKLVLSNLDNEVINSVFLGTIDTVLSMIREEAPNPYYKMSSSMVTLEEELAFYAYFEDDIYSNIDISMQRNNMRFIYLSNKNDAYKHICYSLHSKVSDVDQLFTTFFICKKVKDDSEITEEFICSVILNYMRSLISDKYRIDMYDLIDYCINGNIEKSDFINAFLRLMDIYICYFRTLDQVLNLKYGDCTRIVEAINLFGCSDILRNIEELCYRYAITEDHDPGDYKILCKECLSMYFPSKE